MNIEYTAKQLLHKDRLLTLEENSELYRLEDVYRYRNLQLQAQKKADKKNNIKQKTRKGKGTKNRKDEKEKDRKRKGDTFRKMFSRIKDEENELYEEYKDFKQWEQDMFDCCEQRHYIWLLKREDKKTLVELNNKKTIYNEQLLTLEKLIQETDDDIRTTTQSIETYRQDSEKLDKWFPSKDFSYNAYSIRKRLETKTAWSDIWKRKHPPF